jgi:hypothetical protein
MSKLVMYSRTHQIRAEYLRLVALKFQIPPYPLQLFNPDWPSHFSNYNNSPKEVGSVTQELILEIKQLKNNITMQRK